MMARRGVLRGHDGSSHYEAHAHVIVLAHERIELLTPRRELVSATGRDAGYRAALAEAGMVFEEQRVVEAVSSEAEEYAAANDLLSAPDPLSALLAGSAALAFGTMHAAHNAGLRMGSDLALIVFDDPSSAAHVVPALTAVWQPMFEVGRELACQLVGVIEGQDRPWSIWLQSQLIVRRSCGHAAQAYVLTEERSLHHVQDDSGPA